MELSRELLNDWGYQFAGELVWVKVDQLQKLIVSGRTGMWLWWGKKSVLYIYRESLYSQSIFIKYPNLNLYRVPILLTQSIFGLS